MTNLDLEAWFKGTAHPLLKGTLWVKYEPNLSKGAGGEIFSRQAISDGQKDRRMDGQTDNYRALAERGSNFF